MLKNILVLLVTLTTFGCANAFGGYKPLKFVQITDNHLSFTREDSRHKMLAHSAELLADAVEQINKEKEIKFVMFTGDTIDSPNENDEKKFIGIVKNIKYPWYVALGNHDIAVLGHLSKERYLELLREGNKYFKFQNSYYSFTPQKGYKVIALDAINDSAVTAIGYMPKEQLDWLDKEIENSPDDVILMFLHHPIIEPFGSKGHRISNADEFYSVLKKHKNPMAVITGHYHASKITQHGNILHIASPALVSTPNAFRLITVENKKDKAVFTLTLKETSLKEIQMKAKIMNLGAQRYAGEKKDQEGVYIVETKK